jgi:ADP-heptose:LPS heptosyltransferase
MLELNDKEVRKILIVRMSALGDVAHVLPSLAALRELFPAAHLSWIVEPLGASLLEGHPQIDELVVVPRQKWKAEMRNPLRWPRVLREFLHIAWELRRARFDLVLDFQGNARSAMVLLLGGGRRRIGFHRRDVSERIEAVFTNHKAPLMPPRIPKVAKNLALVREVGFRGDCPRGWVPVGPQEREWARGILGTLKGTGPVVALHPAVSRFGDFKRWPAPHFTALVDLLREKLDARVLLTWGPGEKDIAESVSRPTVLPEPATLKKFVALLEAVDLLVAADTGILPIASMLGTSTVALYGPKDPQVYAPYPFRGQILQSSAPCSPCKLRRCEHRICMVTISPQVVFEKCLLALGERREATDFPAGK